MAKRLKDLTVTKVDFVDKGANPKAHILVTKRDNSQTSAENINVDTDGIVKGIASKLTSLLKGYFSQGDTLLQKNNGGNEEMKFDVSKMTAEEAKVFKSLEEKYGIKEQTEKKADEDVDSEDENDEEEKKGKGSKTSHQAKSADAEITALRKRLEYFENKELLEVAKRYEVLGKKPEEFAETLKSYKAAGGTVYDDVITALDEAVAAVNKSQMFSEIGKKGSDSSGATSKIQKFAQEIMKSDPNVNMYQAIDKAYQLHPELINEEV